ncbi:unnamed protein product, partial [Discosporangium mesarthrocarpum]
MWGEEEGCYPPCSPSSISSRDLSVWSGYSSMGEPLAHSWEDGCDGRSSFSRPKSVDEGSVPTFMDDELTRLHHDLTVRLAECMYRKGSHRSLSVGEGRDPSDGDDCSDDDEDEATKTLRIDIDTALRNFFEESTNSTKTYPAGRRSSHQSMPPKREKKDVRIRRRQSFSGRVFPGSEHLFSPWDVEHTLCPGLPANSNGVQSKSNGWSSTDEDKPQEHIVLHQGSSSNFDTVLGLVNSENEVKSLPTPGTRRWKSFLVRETLAEVTAQTRDAMADLHDLKALLQAEVRAGRRTAGEREAGAGPEAGKFGVGVSEHGAEGPGTDQPAFRLRHLACEGVALSSRLIGRLDWASTQLDEILAGPWLENQSNMESSILAGSDESSRGASFARISKLHLRRSSTALLQSRQLSKDMEPISCSVNGYRVVCSFPQFFVYFQLNITQEETSWGVERSLDEFRSLRRTLAQTFGEDKVPPLNLGEGWLESAGLGTLMGAAGMTPESLAERQILVAEWLASVLADPAFMSRELIVFLDGKEQDFPAVMYHDIGTLLPGHRRGGRNRDMENMDLLLGSASRGRDKNMKARGSAAASHTSEDDGGTVRKDSWVELGSGRGGGHRCSKPWSEQLGE